MEFGADYLRDVREIEDVVADRTLARELGCVPGTRWLRISSLRLMRGDAAGPIGWTDVYVDSAYSSLRDFVRDHPTVLISSLIESRYGRRIAEIRQDVQAVTVPPRLAEKLNDVPGAPALKITRHYLDAASKVFEISKTIHPADRFTFSMRLQRQRTDA
jgi:DNA-binding GntR family transcriptional regulator